MKTKLFTVALSGLMSLCFAQQGNREKLSAYLDSLAAHHKAMGSYALATNGKPDFVKVTGFADAETQQKANVNTQYRIGSVSKIFTAVLVMQAVEGKKLTLQTKLSEFYPSVPNAAQITVEQMLQHRTGIHNLTDEKEYWDYHQKPQSEKQMVDIIAKYKSDFVPGEKHAYSNSNYILLGYILEKIYRKPYADLIQGKIAKPLKLNLTRVGGKINASENQANSYFFNNSQFQKNAETDMSVPVGAGNLISTPTELLKFIIALEEGKLISKASLAQMKDFRDNYGFGLAKIPFINKYGYGHSGRIEEFRSVVFYFPEDKAGISFITNQSDYDVNQISINMLKTAMNMDFEMPDFKVKSVDLSILKTYDGTYKAPNFPLDIKIFVENNKLMAQATGQGAFALEVISDTEFQFLPAGIKIQFNPGKNTFDFKQGAYELVFTKQ